MRTPIRRGAILAATSAQLASRSAPVPSGLLAVAVDTGVQKLGDGVTTWQALPSLSSSAATATSVAGAWRIGTSSGSGLSNGTDTGTNGRCAFKLVDGSRRVRLVYAHFGAAGESLTGVTANLTIKAAVEESAGVYAPVWFGGSRTAVIAPGGYVISDPVAVNILPDTIAWVRTFATTTAGSKWYAAGGTTGGAPYLEAASGGTSETDLTTSGTITGTYAAPVRPLAIINETVTTARLRVLLRGDSIMAGSGDYAADGSWQGFARRALVAAGVPHQSIAIPGERAQNFPGGFRARLATAVVGNNTELCELGINDLTSGRTTAQVQADLIANWAEGSAAGRKVWQTTIMPSATSTDSWATLANQTTVSSNTNRVALNTWLRDGAPMVSGAAVATGTTPAARCAVYDMAGALVGSASGGAHLLSGIVETADAVESSRNSGKWAVNGTASYLTADGTHPSTAGHTLIAAAVTAVLPAMRSAAGVTA